MKQAPETAPPGPNGAPPALGGPIGASDPSSARRVWLVALAACAGVFVLAALIAPHVPMDPRADVTAALAAYLVGFGAVAATTIVSGATVGPLPARAVAVWLPIAGLLAALTWAEIPAQTGLAAIAASGAVLVALLIGGGVAGAVVGGRIAHPGHLSVVAVVSSIADLWSVLTPDGPSAAVAQSAPLLSVLALPFPMLGTDAIEPLLGVGDVVFVALYLTVSRRFELGVGRTIVGLALAFLATALTVIALERAIPALPFLGLGVLIAHREARLPPRGERRTAAIGVGVLALFVIAVLAMRA